MYRMFIKYCVFIQEFSKVCHFSLASIRLLLVLQKITSHYEWLNTPLRWDFEGLFQRCRRGMGWFDLWKTHFFWTPCIWVLSEMWKISIRTFAMIIFNQQMLKTNDRSYVTWWEFFFASKKIISNFSIPRVFAANWYNCAINTNLWPTKLWRSQYILISHKYIYNQI